MRRAGDCREAFRELGYVEALAEDVPLQRIFLDKALGLAEEPEKSCGIHAVIGFNLVDWGRVSDRIEHYEASSCRTPGEPEIAVAKSGPLGLGAWGLLKADRLRDAEQWLAGCLELAEEQSWVAFKPWPLAVQAEVRLRQQVDPSVLRKGSKGLRLELPDGRPVLGGGDRRVIGLTYAAEDRPDLAAGWLSEARSRCLRKTDIFAALLVAIISDQMKISVKTGKPEEARAFARELIPCATRGSHGRRRAAPRPRFSRSGRALSNDILSALR